MVKIAFLTFWNQPKLISHKIWVEEKSLSFHIVNTTKYIFQIWPLNLEKKEPPVKTRTEVVPLGLNPDTVQDTQVIWRILVQKLVDNVGTVVDLKTIQVPATRIVRIRVEVAQVTLKVTNVTESTLVTWRLTARSLVDFVKGDQTAFFFISTFYNQLYSRILNINVNL